MAGNEFTGNPVTDRKPIKIRLSPFLFAVVAVVTMFMIIFLTILKTVLRVLLLPFILMGWVVEKP